MALLLMVALTVSYASVVAYAYANLGYSVHLSVEGKHPTEYDIWKHYFAEKLETEPQEWNTTEELGIIFTYSDVEEHFHIYIVDEEKALPWMRDDDFTPYAVKCEDKFYRILFLWVTPALPEGVKGQVITAGLVLGSGWVFMGAFFISRRNNNEKDAVG